MYSKQAMTLISVSSAKYAFHDHETNHITHETFQWALNVPVTIIQPEKPPFIITHFTIAWPAQTLLTNHIPCR